MALFFFPARSETEVFPLLSHTCLILTQHIPEKIGAERVVEDVISNELFSSFSLLVVLEEEENGESF